MKSMMSFLLRSNCRTQNFRIKFWDFIRVSYDKNYIVSYFLQSL